MNTQIIGLVFAIVGVIASVVWFVLLRRGVRTLGEIRDRLPSEKEAHDDD